MVENKKTEKSIDDYSQKETKLLDSFVKNV